MSVCQECELETTGASYLENPHGFAADEAGEEANNAKSSSCCVMLLHFAVTVHVATM